MSNGLRDCLERLHLSDNKKLTSQSQGLMDQLNSLAGKAINKGPNCKPVIAIQLACERYNVFSYLR